MNISKHLKSLSISVDYLCFDYAQHDKKVAN